MPTGRPATRRAKPPMIRPPRRRSAPGPSDEPASPRRGERMRRWVAPRPMPWSGRPPVPEAARVAAERSAQEAAERAREQRVAQERVDRQRRERARQEQRARDAARAATWAEESRTEPISVEAAPASDRQPAESAETRTHDVRAAATPGLDEITKTTETAESGETTNVPDRTAADRLDSGPADGRTRGSESDRRRRRRIATVTSAVVAVIAIAIVATVVIVKANSYSAAPPIAPAPKIDPAGAGAGRVQHVGADAHGRRAHCGAGPTDGGQAAWVRTSPSPYVMSRLGGCSTATAHRVRPRPPRR